MQKTLITFASLFSFLFQGLSQSINPSVLWATYFGSPGDDLTGYVITDEEDNIYMTSTVQNGAPTSSGVHQATYGGGVSDVMLSKFDKEGGLLWSTYFGGFLEDLTYYPIDLMSDGAIVITGTTKSSNDISTPGAHQEIYGGGTLDIFVAVFEKNGQLRWSTYFGGSGIDSEPAIATDSEDNLYLVGLTTSNQGIATDSTFQPTKKQNEDGFLAKFDKSGELLWSTYYGGQGLDALYGVSLDQYGSIYIGGETYSAQLATSGTFKMTYNGNGDGFLAKFSDKGERVWASYFGSTGYDGIYFMAVDKNNDIICVGPSSSTNGIATEGAYSETNSGNNDVFIAKFNVDGQRLWSTFIGGLDWDTSFGCDFDQDNNMYLSMMSKSLNFPTTSDVPSTMYNGGLWDAVLVKFSKLGELNWSTYFGGKGNDRSIGITLDSEHNIIASINSDSKGLATPGAFNETARGNESLLVKMRDATIVNVSELEVLPSFEVFPNPTTSFIEIPNHKNEMRNITILNEMGEMKMRYLSTRQTHFDISSLLSGLYFIVSDIKNEKSVAKFVKIE